MPGTGLHWIYLKWHSSLFVDNYVICHGCKSPDTNLAKENRLFFMRCEQVTKLVWRFYFYCIILMSCVIFGKWISNICFVFGSVDQNDLWNRSKLVMLRLLVKGRLDIKEVLSLENKEQSMESLDVMLFSFSYSSSNFLTSVTFFFFPSLLSLIITFYYNNNHNDKI